jgi:hypothetical protein
MATTDGLFKHVGRLENTGKNVVVVFMTLPDDKENCLVIDTDSLPDQFNEAIRKVVESTDGQDCKNLGDVLGRRMSPDGSNTTLLEKMHTAGRLQKVPVSLVTMTPRRGVNWPLSDIIKAMNESSLDAPMDNFDDLDPETRAQVAAEIGKFNIHANNMDHAAVQGNKDQAQNLLRMAEILEQDAAQKREQAYRMDPTLQKKVVKTPKTEVVIERLDVPPMLDTSTPTVTKPKAPPRRRIGAGTR